MRVKLAKAFRVPGRPLRAAGSVVEVDEETAADLVRRGVVAEAATAGVVEGDAAPTDDGEADDDGEATAGVVEGDAAPTDDGERPARSASVDKWRAYAEKQGIPTKGLSKQELIAATA